MEILAIALFCVVGLIFGKLIKYILEE